MNSSETLVLERSNRTRRFMYSFGTVMIMIMMMAMCAFAGETEGGFNGMQEGIGQGAAKVWNILKAVVGPIGGALFAWNGIKALFGGEKGMETARKNLLIIVVVMLIVYGAGVIVQEIQGWFSGTATGVFGEFVSG